MPLKSPQYAIKGAAVAYFVEPNGFPGKVNQYLWFSFFLPFFVVVVSKNRVIGAKSKGRKDGKRILLLMCLISRSR